MRQQIGPLVGFVIYGSVRVIGMRRKTALYCRGVSTKMMEGAKTGEKFLSRTDPGLIPGPSTCQTKPPGDKPRQSATPARSILYIVFGSLCHPKTERFGRQHEKDIKQ